MARWVRSAVPRDREGEPRWTSGLADAFKLAVLDDRQHLSPDARCFSIGAALGDPSSDNHRGVLTVYVDHHPGIHVEL